MGFNRGCNGKLISLKRRCPGLPERRSIFARALILTLAAMANVPVARPADITVSISETANLFYQIDCMSNRDTCSWDVFRKLWDQIGWDNETDEASLAEFASIIARYAVTNPLAPSESTSTKPTIFRPEIVDLAPSRLDEFNLRTRIRVAAYRSASMDRLSEQLRLLMDPRDAEAITNILRSFDERFQRWWNSEGQRDLLRFSRELQSLMAGKAKDFIRDTKIFLGAVQAGQSLPVHMHLIAHPMPRGSTYGRQFGSHNYIEVLRSEVAEQRIGVVVHELAHYLFQNAPRSLHERRLRGTQNAGDPAAPAALALMDEAIATAIGNGVLEKRLRGADFPTYLERPLSFYNDEAIDTAAKLILELVDEYLSAPKELDDDFVNRYFALLLNEMTPQLDTLEARFRLTATYAVDRDLAKLAVEVVKELNSTSAYSQVLTEGDAVADSVLARHTYLNGLVLARPDSLHEIAGLIEKPNEIKVGLVDGMMACTVERPSRALLYLVVVPVDKVDLNSTTLIERLKMSGPCSDKIVSIRLQP